MCDVNVVAVVVRRVPHYYSTTDYCCYLVDTTVLYGIVQLESRYYCCSACPYTATINTW